MLVKAWDTEDYGTAAKYLQSEALRTINIMPEFAGALVHTKPSCLMIFAGYEPNRTEGLIQNYGADRIVAFYGQSPHRRLEWRTELSRKLHRRVFAKLHVREIEVSTLNVGEILAELETEFSILKDYFDIAVAPLCAKMHAIASYLFWRRHPEVQLVFTSPLLFNPKHYSLKAGRIYFYQLPPARPSHSEHAGNELIATVVAAGT